MVYAAVFYRANDKSAVDGLTHNAGLKGHQPPERRDTMESRGVDLWHNLMQASPHWKEIRVSWETPVNNMLRT